MFLQRLFKNCNNPLRKFEYQAIWNLSIPDPNKFDISPPNPVENYCIRIIQCMFDKGLEKLGFIQSSDGGFREFIFNI